MTRAILVLVFLALAACSGLDDAKKCAERTGDPELDVDYCTRAIDSGNLSNEGLGTTFNNRGNAYLGKGEYDLAIADYNQAIRLKPDYALAFSNRGNAYKAKDECDHAIRDYDQATLLDPDNSHVYGHMRMACVLQTAINAALRDLRKDHDPGSRPQRLLDKLKEHSVLP